MAISSKEWFLGKCLEEERKTSPFGPLARRVLDLGLRRTSKTAGHILQACGATQRFLEMYPVHKRTIAKTSPLDRFPLYKHQHVLADWKNFFQEPVRSVWTSQIRLQLGYAKDLLDPEVWRKTRWWRGRRQLV